MRKLLNESKFSLAQEEILTCDKTNYTVNEKRYKKFILVLYKFIDLQKKNKEIILYNISFPRMTFNTSFFGSKNIIFMASTFYDKVNFFNIRHDFNFTIDGSLFKSEVLFDNMCIGGNTSINSNIFEKSTVFQNIKFYGEVYFSSVYFKSSLIFDKIEFNKQTTFFEIEINDEAIFKQLSGVKWLEGDELFCKLSIDFDSRSKYINVQENSKIINIIEGMKRKFPNDFKVIQLQLSDCIFSGCYEYLDRFADITLKYIELKKYNQAKEHLIFISEIWNSIDEDSKHILYTYYIENLMYGHKTNILNKFNSFYIKWFDNVSNINVEGSSPNLLSSKPNTLK